MRACGLERRNESMNAMERVKRALSHQEADRVPVCPILSGVTRRLAGATYPHWSTDARTCADALLKAADEFELDCIVTLIDLSVECDAWGQEIVFPENEAAHPDSTRRLIRDIEGYAGIRKADYRQSERMRMHIDVCRRLVEARGGEVPIVAFVFGPLGVLSMLRGQQELFMDLYDDPDAVKGAVEAVADTLADYAAALCETGVDGVMWDTLFASGSIMSKDMWREMEAGPIARLAQVVRDHGCLNMVHNCGQRPYFDVQIEAISPAAISFLYPPDDCAGFAECKAKYGDAVTLIGCVPPTSAVIGTDDEWDAHCRAQIDAMSAGGGFILSTGCEYPANAGLERARRMVQTAKDYGIYSGR